MLCRLFFLMLMLSAPTLRAAEIISFDQCNPPFMYEQNGRVSGLYPDIINEAFRRMNQPVSLQCIPWTRALTGLDRGEWGVCGLYKTSERARKYDFSDPVYEEVLLIYTLKGHEFAFSGLSDLFGKHIGVLRGWSYGDEFDQAVATGKISTEPVNSDRVNLSRLLVGRVDAIVMTPESFLLVREDDPSARTIALDLPLAVHKTYLSFSKNSHKAYLLERFNACIRAMRQDGSFNRIVRGSMQ